MRALGWMRLLPCAGAPRQWLLLATIVSAAVACSDPPAAPESPYPNMSGSWVGALNINTGGNICTHSWNIVTQTAGSFAGSFQLQGGCRITAGSVSGGVNEAGALTINPYFPLDNDCVRVSGGVFSGRVSGSSITAAASEFIRCTGTSGLFEFTRTLDLTLSR